MDNGKENGNYYLGFRALGVYGFRALQHESYKLGHWQKDQWLKPIPIAWLQKAAPKDNKG